jgi:hypothetical protein
MLVNSIRKRKLALLSFMAAVSVFIVFYLFEAAEPQSVYLLTLKRNNGMTSQEKQSRYWIASVKKTGEEPEICTGSFFTASSPSVSYDGRNFIFSGKKKPEDRTGIWEMRIRCSGLRLITEGNGNPDEPAYLPDGRIVFSDNPVKEGKTAGKIRSLYSCSKDGSDIKRLTFGNHIDSNPEVLPDGRIVFERSSSSQAPLRMTIRPDGTKISLHVSSSESSEPLTEYKNRLTGEYTVVDSVPAVKKPVPRILPSVVLEDRTTGTFFCLNVYESQLPFISGLKKGDIARVRVSRESLFPFRQEKLSSEYVLGDAPVMEDGSFYIEVPSDTPLLFDLFGKDGALLASSKSSVWVRPNENRGCIGCHEDYNLAPENRQPLAVTKPPVPLLKKPNLREEGDEF